MRAEGGLTVGGFYDYMDTKMLYALAISFHQLKKDNKMFWIGYAIISNLDRSNCLIVWLFERLFEALVTLDLSAKDKVEEAH